MNRGVAMQANRSELSRWLRECRADGASNKVLKKLKMHSYPEKPTVFDFLSRSKSDEGVILCRSNENGEYWTDKWLLDSSWLDYTDEQLFNEFGLYPWYRGPGQSFGNTGHIQRSNHSILITRTGGLDV